MKTAMQELIDGIDESIYHPKTSEEDKYALTSVKLFAEGLLEIEKEQIIEARENGLMDGISAYVLTEWGKDSELLTSEQYYNQKYQSK